MFLVLENTEIEGHMTLTTDGLGLLALLLPATGCVSAPIYEVSVHFRPVNASEFFPTVLFIFPKWGIYNFVE